MWSKLFIIPFFFLLYSTKCLAIACDDTSDCPSDAKYCTEFGVCEDCCISEFAVCPSDCVADVGSNECRNDAGTECVLTIPEVPTQTRFWLLPLIAYLSVTAITLLGRKKLLRFLGVGKDA